MNIGLNWRYMPEQPSGALIANPDATNLPTEAYSLFNLNGSWQFTDNFRLRGGIDNLFDTEPPLTGRNPNHPTNPSNGLGITSAGNYDSLGRRYFVGLAVTF
jgi:iron complex outermembrane recepter protein